MTDLSRLTVSLTKHNAHKVARLLKSYRIDQLMDKLDEVHAERAQARKNLSIQSGDTVPAVWDKAKQLGDDAIDALVLVGIIFSHHKLIKAVAAASERSGFSGRIERGVQLSDVKEYTNFVRVIDQLGYATKWERSGVTFNFRPMFEIPGLGPLVGELLRYKLLKARWDGSGAVEDEAIAQGFHHVFGVSATELKAWLSVGAQPASAGSSMLPKDEEFFQGGDRDVGGESFQFAPGHEERSVEPISRKQSPKAQVNQLHNDIQNRLYVYLKAKLGARNVGTEIDSGSGTSIDLVTKQGGEFTFYEIKTASSVRASIRQAIPQLLEYAFWPSERRASELVIVSHLPATRQSKRYLRFLREEFGVPLFYRQFDMSRDQLL